MGDRARRPDFVVVGAMKAGTTSLFQWLDTHPQCRLSPVKEPHFFSREEEYARGVDHYLRLFAGVPDDMVTGESSASYADPRIATTVVRRMVQVAPDVKLVYLVRDPVERMRSHYLHEWQRSRERRPFLEAVTSPDNAYAAMSRYAETAGQLAAVVGDDRLLVLPTEELLTPDTPGWSRVTDYLGIAAHPGSHGRANVSDGKVAFTPWLLRLWESGWLDRARRLPGPVRRLARRAASGATDDLSRQADLVRDTAVPTDLSEELAAQWTAVLERAAT